MKTILKIFFLFLSIFALNAQEERWNWEDIDVHSSVFPKDFMWGIGLAEYQYSGAINCPHSNWATWEKGPYQQHRSSWACNFWNSSEQVITSAQKLGVNALRFSVEWGNIEPEEGQFNPAAIKHYQDLCDALIKAGIKPIVTLHHFTHPQWFEEKGAFEKKSNISYFVRFCETMFNALGDRVSLWCTINEPTVYMLQGYMRGVYPPGVCNIGKAGRVLRNLLTAHVAVYKKIKSLPGGEDAHVGIVHNILQFHPFSDTSYAEASVCRQFNHIMNECVMQFFETGKFRFDVPLFARLRSNNPDAPHSLDFIGLNYYSHVLLQYTGIFNNFFQDGYRNIDIKTDMPYAFYPEGFYDAIKQVSVFNVPIYITENGIADVQDNKRELFIRRYLYALSQAIDDGFDVRGYIYWSLFDNFEWDMGYTQKFGLFNYNFNEQQATLRPGGRAYRDIIKEHQTKN